MEITLHAGIRIFNANANAAAEPVFQHQLDFGTMVLPRRRGQPNQGGGEGGEVQGEGGEVQGEGGEVRGEGGQGEGGDRAQ